MASIIDTIAAKSDQLNADDLIGGPITVRVAEVRFTGSEQPVAIHYEGDGGKPFMACKSMRRVLVNVWGPDANAYVGRSMTLYRDPSVKWGGVPVGGIRISHMSHIDRDVTMALTETRANRKPFTVKPLKDGAATASGSPRTAEARSDAPNDQAAPTLAERVTRAEAVLAKCATTADVDTAWTRMADLRTAAASDEDLLRRLSDAHQRAIDAFADEPADGPTY